MWIVLVLSIFSTSFVESQTDDNPLIYCSGPLFNNYEKQNMQDISDALETNNFKTYLPQRDGVEQLFSWIEKSAKIFPDISIFDKIRQFISRAVYSVDVYQIVQSRAMVINLNGRIVDEGSGVEGGIAFAAGKPILLYKDDVRSECFGDDNSMVVGLSLPNFGKVVHKIEEIPSKMDSLLAKSVIFDYLANVPVEMKKTIEFGKTIWEILELFKSVEDDYSRVKICLQMAEFLEANF